MSNVVNFSKRNKGLKKGFKKGFSSSQKLIVNQIHSIKSSLHKKMIVILIVLLVAIQGLSLIYFNYRFSSLGKMIDNRYFRIKQKLEVYNGKIQDGKVVKRY